MKTQTAYLKLTKATETHNGFKFKTGLNTDTNPFEPDPEHECGPYGLYFTDVKHVLAWLDVDIAYVREVTLPKGEPIVSMRDKYRTHRIILGNRHALSKVATWKWLESKGLDVSAEANYLVSWASMHGHLDVVKFLVSLGADVSEYDNLAVQVASVNGHLDVVKFLVSKGADVSAGDNCSVNGAIERGHLDVVKFLVSHGADITADDNYAVRLASVNGYFDVVKFLVSHGATL